MRATRVIYLLMDVPQFHEDDSACDNGDQNDQYGDEQQLVLYPAENHSLEIELKSVFDTLNHSFPSFLRAAPSFLKMPFIGLV